jgi:putative IMPACT (imprinted ancient) family translation regulator
MANIGLTLDYSRIQPLEYTLKKLDGYIVRQDYAEQVRLLIRLPAEHLDTLRQAFPGNY